ncbi:hypothetical protein [Mucilaginibacter pallidiroseus]|uniref:hypothetical protein n=1 Tax=Mucilaginibacter pallidiroseus TaxID=2599295 RepID=UPI0011B78C44|nr:hypothetical protein [Mucilaginibacter pallidiroseus]
MTFTVKSYQCFKDFVSEICLRNNIQEPDRYHVHHQGDINKVQLSDAFIEHLKKYPVAFEQLVNYKG